jgi:drug/metabolite transporter (DMT)-like permease
MIIGVQIGIAFAFVAMLCWGFGDFFIQKSTRKVGDIEALFLITFIGVVILLPFVATRLVSLLDASNTQIVVLGIASIVILIAAILDFEALKIGKLSIVEPTWSLEVPAAALLAFFILGEAISFNQIVLIVILIFSLGLVSFKGGKITKKIFLEKGFWYAFFGALVMGGANFFIGWGARVTDPIMVNFVTDFFIMFVTGLMLISRGRLLNTFKDFSKNLSVILTMGIADKVAWVAFTFSMVLAPIAVAVALSESYIIIAVLFGLFVNKEKIKRHQYFGLVLAIVTAITLAAITGNN